MEKYEKLYLFADKMAKPFFLENICLENYCSADGSLFTNEFLKTCQFIYEKFDKQYGWNAYHSFYDDCYDESLQRYVRNLIDNVTDDSMKERFRQKLNEVCGKFKDGCVAPEGDNVFSEMLKEYRIIEESIIV